MTSKKTANKEIPHAVKSYNSPFFQIKNAVDAKPIVQDFSLNLIGWLSRLSSVIIVESAVLLAAVIGQESRGQAKKVGKELPRIFPIGEGDLEGFEVD